MNSFAAVSVVVPFYRSAATLMELHRRLSATLGRMCDQYEVIFVEDCGGDGSWDVIQALVNSDPRVRGLRHGRNYGQHNAL